MKETWESLRDIESKINDLRDTVSKTNFSAGVMHPCQRMAGITHHSACRSRKETKAYKIMADREAYVCINVKVYLCPKCAEEMGV